MHNNLSWKILVLNADALDPPHLSAGIGSKKS
jgi:hypothetical protein